MRFFSSNTAKEIVPIIGASLTGAGATILSALVYISEYNALYDSGKNMGVQDAKEHHKYQLNSNYRPLEPYSFGQAMGAGVSTLGLPCTAMAYFIGRGIYNSFHSEIALSTNVKRAVGCGIAGVSFLALYSIFIFLADGQNIQNDGYYNGYQKTCPGSGAEPCIGNVQNANAGHVREMPLAATITGAIAAGLAIPFMWSVTRFFAKKEQSQNQEAQELLPSPRPAV